MTDQIIFTSKQELLKALKDARKRAVVRDAEVTRAHKAAEKAWHAEAKAALKDTAATLAKMSYAELRAKAGHSGDITVKAKTSAPPKCPWLVVPLIDRQIAIITASAQEKYTVTQKSYGNLWEALTFDFPTTKAVC